MKTFLTAIALTIAAPAFAQTAAPAPMDHGDHAEHQADKASSDHKMDCCEKMKAKGKTMDCCEKMDGCDKTKDHAKDKGAAAGHSGHDMGSH